MGANLGGSIALTKPKNNPLVIRPDSRESVFQKTRGFRREHNSLCSPNEAWLYQKNENS
jgi:hypothetical protein